MIKIDEIDKLVQHINKIDMTDGNNVIAVGYIKLIARDIDNMLNKKNPMTVIDSLRKVYEVLNKQPKQPKE